MNENGSTVPQKASYGTLLTNFISEVVTLATEIVEEAEVILGPICEESDSKSAERTVQDFSGYPPFLKRIACDVEQIKYNLKRIHDVLKAVAI
jgi:hypothetical protein